MDIDEDSIHTTADVENPLPVQFNSMADQWSDELFEMAGISLKDVEDIWVHIWNDGELGYSKKVQIDTVEDQTIELSFDLDIHEDYRGNFGQTDTERPLTDFIDDESLLDKYRHELETNCDI
jgi:hypothetical protein